MGSVSKEFGVAAMAQTSGRAQPARSRNSALLSRAKSRWQGELKLLRLVPAAHRLPWAIAATLRGFSMVKCYFYRRSGEYY